jgi:hypothetical protein
MPWLPSFPGTGPTPAPELIATQARSAGWPMAASLSWFSAGEEQPCSPPRPLDHSCCAIQSRVSMASAVVLVRNPNSPSDHSVPRSFWTITTYSASNSALLSSLVRSTDVVAYGVRIMNVGRRPSARGRMITVASRTPSRIGSMR